MNRNPRRRLLVGGAAALAVAAIPVIGATRGIPRVVWVGGAGNPEIQAGIRELMAKAGLVAGRDCVLEFTEAREPGNSPYEPLYRRIIASRPDVVVGPINLPTMKRLTDDIPVVFINWPGDPAEQGLVESLRRPGGNMTGTFNGDLLSSWLFGLLKEIDPSIEVLGLLSEVPLEDRYDHEDIARQVADIQREAAKAGIPQVRPVAVQAGASTAMIASAIARSGAQALLIVADYPITPQFVSFLQKTTIPSATLYFRNVRKGVLMGISFESEEGPQHAIGMVAQILRGQKPATIPIYQSTRRTLAVNLRTASSAGIRIPSSILLRADEIIR